MERRSRRLAGSGLVGVFASSAASLAGGPTPDPDCGWTLTASGPLVEVNDFAAFDDGTGRTLYACGKFNFDGPEIAANLLRWDGGSWSYAGTNFPPTLEPDSANQMVVYVENGSEVLFVGGAWVPPGGSSSVATIARWDGSQWDIVDGETVFGSSQGGMVAFDDGSGPALFVAGELTLDNKASYTSIVKWDGAAWTTAHANLSPFSLIYAIEIFDAGDGPRLYAGGNLFFGRSFLSVASWTGSEWEPVTGAPELDVHSMHVHDDGTGPALFVGYNGGIARWDGTDWVDVNQDGTWNSVDGMTSYDDGSISRLYAKGSMNVPIGRYWDGTSWHPFGDQFSTSFYYYSSGMTTYDDGAGPVVFVNPLSITGVQGDRYDGIARWVNWETRCPDAFRADYLRDCRLDFFDIRVFLDLFLTQDPAADFNGDGVFDFADVSDFIDAFVGGCP